ncbi:hypothetical protein 015DV002_150 [Bacillus phage 015DV002]|nr:hypothetical protein 000TH008_159 [Bacillus phage 000TH008]QQO40853.1 hypothetical protein 000TH009_159 [Bacillus phage 000TH009]QQO41104.1 hypothetical protein 015DV002_150 [Bacillus phage 015DV002]QQO41381.1 hypothetical protein 015DV004_166 [Bacillus phage 015DV004]
MPAERRDPASKARLFIPTTRERSLVRDQRQLTQSLEEVEKIKQELQNMMDTLKNKE